MSGGGHPDGRDDLDLLGLVDEVRGIAQQGLEYATDPYDRERYERLLALAVSAYGAALALPEPEVRARLGRDLGYVTAKVGADAAIFDDRERLLLVRRVDDGRWGLVSGWVDPGETPPETAVREVREEVGLDVRVDRLVDVVGRRPGRWGPHSVVSCVYLCAVLGGELRVQPHEVTEARWWSLGDVPAWHHNHEDLARRALAAHRGRSRR